LISIKKYNDNLQYDWDDFIKKSKHGTIFHNQKFLSYHILKKQRDSSLMFYSKKELLAVLPAAIINKKNKKILISHPGASFGGFIIKKTNYQICESVLIAFEKHCINNNISQCKIIQTPYYYNLNSDNLVEYLMIINNYKTSENYISHVVYLNNKNPLTYLNKRKQRYIKNNFLNKKLYQFNSTNDVSAFYNLLIQNKKKFGAMPTHSLNEIKKLLFLYPKRCFLKGTFYNKEMIGGVFVFITSQSSALLFYNVVSSRHTSANIGSYQIYECINFCLNESLNMLDLGVSHLPNNKNPLDPKLSLIKFKEQCGGVGVMRNIYIKFFNKND